MKEKLGGKNQTVEAQRQEIIDTVIEKSVNGEIVWDFTHFNDKDRGRIAHAKYRRLILISGDSNEGGVEFSIVLEEPYGLVRNIDSFVGSKALKVRRELENLVPSNEKIDKKTLFRKRENLILASDMLSQ